METIKYIDYTGFYYINQYYTAGWLDVLMPLLREKLFWLPLYLVLVLYIIIRSPKQAVFILAGAGLTILLSDQISASLIKPLFHRIRPCNNPFWDAYIHSLVPCGAGFSFVSSHAANHFALAVFGGMMLRDRKWFLPILLIWAFTIAYAQVYVGLHYPFDVTAGALLGCGIGYAVARLAMKVMKTVAHKLEQSST